MKLRPYGDSAVLLDCDSLAEAQSWFAALADGPDEAVLGARTVLVRGEPGVVRARVGAVAPRPLEVGDATTVEIPVVYDGDDLDAVGALLGLSCDEVVAAHAGAPWTVAFGGFAPGFFYLVDGDARLLDVPRRPSPRTRVPAGAVALAGGFSGVYPRSSPGGWQLLGRTDATLWDVDREPPALLRPGTRVQFRAVG